MTTPTDIIEAIAELPGPDQDALSEALSGGYAYGLTNRACHAVRRLPQNFMDVGCDGDCEAAIDARSELSNTEDELSSVESDLQERDRELSDAEDRIAALEDWMTAATSLLADNNIEAPDFG